MDDRTTLTDRITFAQRWLDRAQGHIQAGEVSRGAVTMLLAEAELHRARETGLPAASARGVGAWPAMIAAVALAASAAAVTFRSDRSDLRSEAASSMPAIVSLSAQTGEMLRLVGFPEPPVERTVIRPVILRVPVPAAIPARQVASVRPQVAAPPQAARPARGPEATSGRVAPAMPAPAPAPPAVASQAPAPAPVLLSEADVIDLVLAAERSLRRSANR